jgi:hypothetical protein
MTLRELFSVLLKLFLFLLLLFLLRTASACRKDESVQVIAVVAPCRSITGYSFARDE